jgi:hypothetical protein
MVRFVPAYPEALEVDAYLRGSLWPQVTKPATYHPIPDKKSVPGALPPIGARRRSTEVVDLQGLSCARQDSNLRLAD